MVAVTMSVMLFLLIAGGSLTFFVVGVPAIMYLAEDGWDEGKGLLAISLSGLYFGVVALLTAITYYPIA